MLREFAAGASVMALPIVALLLFVTVFAVMIVRALKLKDDRLAALPLADDTEGDRS